MGTIFSAIIAIIIGIFKGIVYLIMLVVKFIPVIITFLIAIITAIIKGIVYLFMLVVKFIPVIINFLIKIIIALWKFIISFFKIIISGLGKIFSFLGKFIASGWKIVTSFFAKGGAVASSVVKTPIVIKTIATPVAVITKTIATTATGVALSVGSGTVQTTKTLTPVITKTAVSVSKPIVQTTKRVISSSGKIVRRITKIEKDLIKNAKHTKVSGKLVAKRNSTFNFKEKDALGRTNTERMKQGLAPIGKDGKSVELHHLKQKNDGKIVELTSKEHNYNSKILHRYTNKSEINRQDFDKWKKQYWKERVKDFE